MMTGSNPCYSNVPPGLPTYAIPEEDIVSSSHHEASSAASETHTNTFLYNLSLLKEKVHQVQSLASIFISPDHSQHNPESTAIAMPTMGTLIQEIIVTASSLMFTCQQMALGASSANNNTNVELQHQHVKLADHGPSTQPSCDNSHVAQSGEERVQQGFYCKETLDWYGDHNYNICKNNDNNTRSTISGSNHNEEHRMDFSAKKETNGDPQKLSPRNYDIFELDAADLLAKYTHYCQVCGKGFKRDANLRMHMRAHGDEYKSNAALSNPMKNNNGPGHGDDGSPKLPRKYSCPQEGCRWNKKHAKFQPLKSMICVKNHYKRSHCPKMYVCNRCNRKQFSLLSDLRTHEKHCGDLKWQCSCGTTFSRKDKLMGHVALFVGHTPLVSPFTAMRKAGENSGQIQLDNR